MADAPLPTIMGLQFDFDVRINVRNVRDGKDIEDPVFSHRLVLSSSSVLFRGLLSAAPDRGMAFIDIDVRVVPNGLAAFKAMVAGLYSGEVSYGDAEPSQIICVARLCQVPSIENKVMMSTMNMNPLALLLQQHNTLQSSTFQSYFQSLLALYLQPGLAQNNLLAASLPVPASAPLLTPPSSNDDSSSRAQSDVRSEDSSPRTTSPADMDKILPSDDKEGWCRNKKYIEKVEKGFMCTVCRKVYGRYNSVSYHVTIYHRNPPIRCDEAGCQFSTREARYIHFHKYYRHQIPLPDSIDLGSRKCPFCRHVSKSPAMLDKHIARHEQEGKEHGHNCDKCIYRGKSASLLQRHKQFAHPADVFPQSADVFPQPVACTMCPFAATSQAALLLHIATAHPITPIHTTVDHEIKIEEDIEV